MPGLITRLKAAATSLKSGTSESYIIADQGAPQYAWQFTPITSPGQLARRRNLPTNTQSEMLELAHHFLRSNPLAHRMIEIPVQYSIGDGIRYTALSDNVRRVLDRHWDNPVNNWSVNQTKRSEDLGLTGEQFIPGYVNDEDGSVELGYIDPSLVQTVIADTENGMKDYAVLLKRLPGDNDHVMRAYKIIGQQAVSAKSPIFGKLVGLAKDKEEADKWGVPEYFGQTVRLPVRNSIGSSTNPNIRWSGSVFFFKVNSPLSASRGWSDLLSEMDWMDAHDQYLFATVEKAINAGRYVVDVLLKGMTETQQREWLSKNRKTFEPGEWWTRNENVEINFPSPDLKLEDASILSSTIKSYYVAGSGLAPFWLGDTSTSRANAPEMTDAAFKSIRSRQREIAYMLSQIFRFAIDQAELAGMPLGDKRTSPGTSAHTESRSFYLRMPDVSAKDQRMLSIAVKNIAGALKEALDSKFMEAEEATRIFRRYLELLGFDAWKDEPVSLEVALDPRFNVSTLFKAASGLYSELGNSGEMQREINYQGSTYYLYGDVAKDYKAFTESIESQSKANSKNGSSTVPVPSVSE